MKIYSKTNISVNYGHLVIHEMEMNSFNDHRNRKIRVWLPADYDNGKKQYPVFYMQDGQNLFSDNETCNKWYLDQEMAELNKGGFSAIIVGIDNANTRMNELCPDLPVNPDVYQICNLNNIVIKPEGNLYAEFIVNQLKPFIDAEYRTLSDKRNTIIGGSSMGGLISLYIILKYPEIFGKALIFSPNLITHFEKDILNILKEYNYAKLKESQIFIYHGGDKLETENWPSVYSAYNLLKEKGMSQNQIAMLFDSRQPHFETAWRKYFKEACYFFNQNM